MDFTNLISDVHELDGTLKRRTASAVNVGLNARNWLIGAWIVEYEQNGSDRAKYGERVVAVLAEKLKIHGLGQRNLEACRRFFRTFPGIAQTVSAKSPESAITTPPELILTRLSFSQIVELLKIDESLKRTFYEIEAIKGNWSVRELKRQIGSLLFERTGLSTNKEKLMRLTDEKVDKLQPGDIIRDPNVFEFVGLRPKEVVEESELEQALLDELQAFLLELGRGFCFEERQKRIQIGSEYYFVDLVFYHRLLKFHVLIDLKTEPFQHSHPGQLNTYVNYYRKNEMADGDQPPIGLLLCTHKDVSLAEYTLGGMDENLFVSSYKTALPEAEKLQRFLNKEARKLGIGGAEPSQES